MLTQRKIGELLQQRPTQNIQAAKEQFGKGISLLFSLFYFKKL